LYGRGRSEKERERERGGRAALFISLATMSKPHLNPFKVSFKKGETSLIFVACKLAS